MSGANARGVKISSCVDCATTIIGERLRCPACHDQHAANLLVNDEDVTLPRDRSAKSPTVRKARKALVKALVVWLSASLIIAVIAVILVAAGRSCR